ncbi:versatile peroxidase VPL1 [Cladorrhinum sp. PSN259]|nr:versatile peroxidase VPL1 [Cladorrhinum sp. PSN259]
MALKSLLFLSLLAILSLSAITANAYVAHGGNRGGGALLNDLTSLPVTKRQSTELLADLKTLTSSQLTTGGRAIKDILQGNSQGADFAESTYTPPGSLGSDACRASTCCVYKYMADEMRSTFRNSDTGQCNNLARQAVRLAFHDSGTWSKTLGGGGADGSIILAGEWTRGENAGMSDIVAKLQTWYDKYRPHGGKMADMVQVAATVATVACPLGPRIRLFVGRNSSSTASPAGRLPDVNDSAQAILDLMSDKTFGTTDVVALVGAHTVSRQRFVDPARIGEGQDTTPGVWDVRFYTETARESGAPEGVLRFASDKKLAAAAGATWSSMADPAGNQFNWAIAYSRAFIRLSLLGVQHINNLKECTNVLPLRDLTV